MRKLSIFYRYPIPPVTLTKIKSDSDYRKIKTKVNKLFQMCLSQKWWATFETPHMGANPPDLQLFITICGKQSKTNQIWDKHFQIVRFKFVKNSSPPRIRRTREPLTRRQGFPGNPPFLTLPGELRRGAAGSVVPRRQRTPWRRQRRTARQGRGSTGIPQSASPRPWHSRAPLRDGSPPPAPRAPPRCALQASPVRH